MNSSGTSMTREGSSLKPAGRRPRKGSNEPVKAHTGKYYTRALRVAGFDLLLAESPNPGSTGSEVWRVAEHLVSLLEHELSPEQLSGKRILELGSGCGLLGLALAVISNGQADITVTDYDPIALGMAQLNVEINNLSNCITVQSFTWGSSINSLVQEAPFDFVVGSDIIYHPHCLPQLLKTLEALASPITTHLIAYEHRQPALEQRFFMDATQKHGLQCTRIKRRYLDKREDASLMSVYQLKKPARGYSSSRPMFGAQTRPQSAMPIMQTESRRPMSSTYQRPFSALSRTDRPAMTTSTASEVRKVDYSSWNKQARAMSARTYSSSAAGRPATAHASYRSHRS